MKRDYKNKTEDRYGRVNKREMMRITTYRRLENLYKKYKGYISTKELLSEGFSNRQIANLAEENFLEKVCHGYYWMIQCGYKKPEDYKCIEVCLGSPRAVIAMESACYYQGIVKTEPEVLTVATERTDRSMIKMNFTVERHYFSDSNFRLGMKRVNTEFGGYNIYNIERSFCDIVRLNDKTMDDEFIIEIYSHIKMHQGQYERTIKYAEMLKLYGAL